MMPEPQVQTQHNLRVDAQRADYRLHPAIHLPNSMPDVQQITTVGESCSRLAWKHVPEALRPAGSQSVSDIAQEPADSSQQQRLHLSVSRARPQAQQHRIGARPQVKHHIRELQQAQHTVICQRLGICSSGWLRVLQQV
jgi:hypothetical protein